MAASYEYNNGYHADPIQRAPSPYHQQNASNEYYNQHPQQFGPAVKHGFDFPSPGVEIVGSNIHPSQPSPYSEGPTPAIDGPEADRGLVGALGGAATGGYVGHQTCHGFLGTVGGAIVSHP